MHAEKLSQVATGNHCLISYLISPLLYQLRVRAPVLVTHVYVDCMQTEVKRKWVDSLNQITRCLALLHFPFAKQLVL